MRCFRRLLNMSMQHMGKFTETPKQLLRNVTNPDHGHETETEVAWLHLKLLKHNQDNYTGCIERKVKKAVGRRRDG